MTVDVRNGQTWPPRNTNSSGVCTIQDINEACYMAGDTRVNQNPQLTILQVALLREHNRLANALAAINPHWDDETLFQEARKINIAESQYITYYEWLPVYIGYGNSLKNRIIYQTSDFVNDYDDSVDPSVLNEHATAAFRFFHALIMGNLETRVGDRFFFENGGPTGFTLPQLNEIRKTSISRLLCDNSNGVRAMQPRGFERISPRYAMALSAC
nr:unnamed protein product [Callosobruchus analis]